MKRVGHLYEAIYNLENIKTAILKASLGKRKQMHVARVLNDIDGHAKTLQKILIEQSFKPSPYSTKIIKDGPSQKEREISKPRFFPDQVIHWALMLQLEPILYKRMYKHSCGSVPGRGTSYGQLKVQKWMREDRKNTKYCLKLDVSKFYPTIDNEILKRMFKRVLKDQRTLNLIDTIIDSAKGLPIGNYTSRWFANFYLESLDNCIKQSGKATYYIRYVDDLVILGPNKRNLHKLRKEIEVHLQTISLKLKSNWQVFKTNSRPLDFLGFKFYHTHTTLRKRNCLRIKRRVKKIKAKHYLNIKDAQAMISYWGWIKSSDSYNYYTKNVKPYVSINACRKVVSAHAKTNSAPRSPSI